MQITFLGTGTSQGVPIIACQCHVCTSDDSRDKRLRSALLVEESNQAYVIDVGPDFRQQMLVNDVKNISAILLTHEHKDHTAGLDDIRPFYYIRKSAIEIYAEKRVGEALVNDFGYIFSKNRYPGVPEVSINQINDQPFVLNDIKVIPVRAWHNKLPVLGFRFGSVCYLTDIKTIEDEELYKLENLDVLIINALRLEPHISHLNLEEALELINKVKPEKAYLTHISHRFGKHTEIESLLPENVYAAYDGLKLCSK